MAEWHIEGALLPRAPIGVTPARQVIAPVRLAPKRPHSRKRFFAASTQAERASPASASHFCFATL